MTVIAMVLVVFGHAALGGLRVLQGGRIRSVCRALSMMRDRGAFWEAYLKNPGGLGSLGLEFSFVGILSVF